MLRSDLCYLDVGWRITGPGASWLCGFSLIWAQEWYVFSKEGSSLRQRALYSDACNRLQQTATDCNRLQQKEGSSLRQRALYSIYVRIRLFDKRDLAIMSMHGVVGFGYKRVWGSPILVCVSLGLSCAEQAPLSWAALLLISVSVLEQGQVERDSNVRECLYVPLYI